MHRCRYFYIDSCNIGLMFNTPQPSAPDTEIDTKKQSIYTAHWLTDDQGSEVVEVAYYSLCSGFIADQDKQQGQVYNGI